ncbi:MAG: helix-turn-helix domain-containing protein [Eubacterium sp.]|nr:helix-turn-helix domain-containing protein [Eubacterium sp.]
MISNQILQNTIEGIHKIIKGHLCVLDTEGNVLASTSKELPDISVHAKAFVESPAESQVINGYNFFKIIDDNQVQYMVVVQGDSEEIYTIGKLIVFQFEGLLRAYKERYDKDNFIKNLLLDNLLLIDIFNRAKKLHIETNASRVVFIVETTKSKDNGVLETVRNLFANQAKDFITAVDEQNIIIVKEVNENEGVNELEKTASVIVDMLNTENMINVRVSFGTVIRELKEVSKSYKEAKLAMDVGKIFYSDKKVVAYSRLGIGRLIYQLPMPLCKMFIKEIFGDNAPDKFEDDTLETINQFFKNNLNVSRTAEVLYIHRNTLVYRLDRLVKITGLDIRKFEDAITFKIALMVVKYMKYLESIDY